jgi:glutamyl-tRNA reductase
MNIAVVGLSHKTAPVEVREKLSIPTAQTGDAIAHLTSCPHIEEVAILSTCNRLEIHIVTQQTEQGVLEVTQFLSEYGKVALHDLREHLFILLHQDAVMHLMRVAAGLDSLVLGEGQIISQVKHTHKLGQQHKGVGRILNQLLKQAISAGKRVRTETSIGTGAVSISSAAAELAKLKVPNLKACRISILGGGQDGAAAGAAPALERFLSNHHAQPHHPVGPMNWRPSLMGPASKPAPWTRCWRRCAGSDVVFTCTSATEPILDRAKLEAVLSPSQSLMLFDISVPRNVHAM